MSMWHCYVNEQTYGPYTEDQMRDMLANGHITEDTLVWCDKPEYAERGWVCAGNTDLTLTTIATEFSPIVEYNPQSRISIETTQDHHKPDTDILLSDTTSFHATDNITRKSYKCIVIALSVFVVLSIIGVVAFFLVRAHQEEVARQQAEQERIIAEQAQKETMVMISVLIVKSGSEAESMANFISKIWHNAIYEESNWETNKYTIITPGSYSAYWNFNIALANYSDDETTKLKRQRLENDQNEIKELMRSVQNPPTELRDTYNALNDLFDAYGKLIDLAIYPSGSLQTYNNTKNAAVSDFSSAYRLLETRIH